MFLRKDRGWRCAVKQREANRRFYRRHTEESKARVARRKMQVRGDHGVWMNVLRIERVTEITDGAS